MIEAEQIENQDHRKAPQVEKVHRNARDFLLTSTLRKTSLI